LILIVAFKIGGEKLGRKRKSKNIVQKKKQTWAHTRSWATAGGFAEAIGGVGVGVATAL
jgi:hypothetical protein